MAASTNIHGFNIGGNNNSFDQRGHFYRAFLDGNVSGMLVKQNSTPNMTVLVEHGSALLNKNTTSASIAEIKSDTSVIIDTANTSNPRIDTVVIYEDTSVAIPTVENDYWQDGAGGRFKIASLPGTAAAVPVALSDANIQTAIGAGKPWARLADITVPANSTTIINSNIADRRVKLSSVIANGMVIQTATATFSSVATGTTTIPNDDTIPQITEGNEYMTLSFTPKSATSKLRIEATAMLSHTSGTSVMSVALFKEATANALAAVSETITAGFAPVTIKLDVAITSGTTSAITFRIRAGAHTAGTTTFNGYNGNRMFGDIPKSSIVITEISA